MEPDAGSRKPIGNARGLFGRDEQSEIISLIVGAISNRCFFDSCPRRLSPPGAMQDNDGARFLTENFVKPQLPILAGDLPLPPRIEERVVPVLKKVVQFLGDRLVLLAERKCHIEFVGTFVATHGGTPDTKSSDQKLRRVSVGGASA